jgi:hypothetical protein
VGVGVLVRKGVGLAVEVGEGVKVFAGMGDGLAVLLGISVAVAVTSAMASTTGSAISRSTTSEVVWASGIDEAVGVASAAGITAARDGFPQIFSIAKRSNGCAEKAPGDGNDQKIGPPALRRVRYQGRATPAKETGPYRVTLSSYLALPGSLIHSPFPQPAHLIEHVQEADYSILYTQQQLLIPAVSPDAIDLRLGPTPIHVFHSAVYDPSPAIDEAE